MHMAIAAASGLNVEMWDTGLLAVVAGGMKILAVLVVLGAAVKSIKDFTGGKVGAGAKVIIGAVIVATFLWEPSLINRIIDAFASLSGSGIDQVGEIAKTGTDTSGLTGTK